MYTSVPRVLCLNTNILFCHVANKIMFKMMSVLQTVSVAALSSWVGHFCMQLHINTQVEHI